MVTRRSLAILALLTLNGWPATGRAQEAGLAIGSVPAAVQVEDLDGRPVDLGTWVGSRPVLIEFWATWCPVCDDLGPQLTAIRKRYAGKLEVLQVAVGVNQNPRSIRRHVARHPQPGVLLFDPSGKAARAYEAPATSYVVALDAKGRVVYTGVGGDQDLESAARRALR